MNSRCEWIETIASLSRKTEVDSLGKILKDPKVGVLHIFGDKGIGKRTLVQCLAQKLLSGESDFDGVFMVDLLSELLALDEWNVESCDWMANQRLPSRSLMSVLQVLFDNCVEREVEGALGKGSSQKRILIVLRDYESPNLQKRTIEEDAVQQIQCLMKQKRLVLILLSEANLLDRSHNESQRLRAYRRLFYTTKGWQYKVGLLSTEDDAKNAIKLSFQRKKAYDEPASKPTDNQMNAVLQAAGPHPGQIDQAVASLASRADDTSLKRNLVLGLLQANKAVYEGTWNGLQQREKSVLLTYSLIKRDELERVDAQSRLEQHIDDFSATDTDFDDAEKKRDDPWSRVGQCLLPWSTEAKYQFFSEAFADFVEGKLPPELSPESTSNWRTYVRTPTFLFIMFFASMAVGFVMLLLAIAFKPPRLLIVFLPLLPVFAFFVTFLISHVPAPKR